MSRKGSPGIRSVLPDPKHGSEMVARFINMVMKSGKKAVAERIVYGALDTVKEKLNKDPVEVFEEALENIAPHYRHGQAFRIRCETTSQNPCHSHTNEISALPAMTCPFSDIRGHPAADPIPPVACSVLTRVARLPWGIVFSS